MKFWDREKEKKWLKHYLLTEPNAILFVYGPKSSGKTTLLMKVVEELPKEKFIYYWFDLRGKLLSNYKDVIDMFFVDEESYRELEEITERVESGIMSFFRVSVEKKEKIEQKKIDAFEYMERALKKHLQEGRKPVIIFDELQKLKDIYLNGGSQRPLIKELFNFFVRLTKVLHLAHVIVMTSDTFFIDQVYTDSTLKNTSRFYLVDFFDNKTAEEILISEGFNEKEASYIVNHIGGVPWMMEEMIESEDYKEALEELYNQTLSRIFETIRGREDLRELLRKALSGENLYYLEEGYDKVKELVDEEILFMNPIRREVKFHTRLDELAAKELLEEIG